MINLPANANPIPIHKNITHVTIEKYLIRTWLLNTPLLASGIAHDQIKPPENNKIINKMEGKNKILTIFLILCLYRTRLSKIVLKDTVKYNQL